MMQAGRLDQHITIERFVTVMHPDGTQLQEWATLGTLRRSASVRPASGTEGYTTPQTVALELTEFRIRYSSDVAAASPLDRIIYPAFTAAEAGASPPVEASLTRQYNIIAVHEIGRREALQIIAARRPDAAVSESVIVAAAGAAGGAGV